MKFGLALANIGRLHSITLPVFFFICPLCCSPSPSIKNSTNFCFGSLCWINFNITFPIANRLITVRYTAPVDNIVWKRDALQPIGQKIVKLLYDMSFDTNPIILHVFSNGGAYLYKYIDLATKEFQSPLDVGFNQTDAQQFDYESHSFCSISYFDCRFVA